MSLESAGQIAGLFALLGYVPYITTILLKTTVPNRATWFIWATLGGIVVVSYWASGASNTLWVAISHFVGQTTIAFLSIRWGEGGWTSIDQLCLLGAAISLLGWGISSSPLVALTMSLAIDLLGAIPTIKKAYLAPATEDYLSWLLFFSGNVINLFAIQSWSIVILSYPVYLFVMSGVVFMLLNRSKIFSKRGSS